MKLRPAPHQAEYDRQMAELERQAAKILLANAAKWAEPLLGESDVKEVKGESWL